MFHSMSTFASMEGNSSSESTWKRSFSVARSVGRTAFPQRSASACISAKDCCSEKQSDRCFDSEPRHRQGIEGENTKSMWFTSVESTERTRSLYTSSRFPIQTNAASTITEAANSTARSFALYCSNKQQSQNRLHCRSIVSSAIQLRSCKRAEKPSGRVRDYNKQSAKANEQRSEFPLLKAD